MVTDDSVQAQPVNESKVLCFKSRSFSIFSCLLFSVMIGDSSQTSCFCFQPPMPISLHPSPRAICGLDYFTYLSSHILGSLSLPVECLTPWALIIYSCRPGEHLKSAFFGSCAAVSSVPGRTGGESQMLLLH